LNFAVVHATGRPRAVSEKSALRGLLARLIEKYEKYQSSNYDFSKLSDSFIYALMDGLVGFEMQIELLEGKFKLGQDWSGGVQQAVLEHLRQTARQERSLCDLSATFYKRLEKK
jgi:transcriptional regulator